MGASCDIGAGEAIGSVGDRKGSSSFIRFGAPDDAKGAGTELDLLSQRRLIGVGRTVSHIASRAAFARCLSDRLRLALTTTGLVDLGQNGFGLTEPICILNGKSVHVQAALAHLGKLTCRRRSSWFVRQR